MGTVTDRRFAVLIISNGRPDSVVTVDALQMCGFTGDWYIVIDDEDPTGQLYRDRYGDDRVISFSKSAYIDSVDIMDNDPSTRSAVYVRNACWDIAKRNNLTHFLVLDDDYESFRIRDQIGDVLRAYLMESLDDVCEIMLDLLDDTGVAAVAFSQPGDMIGGVESGNWRRRLLRKAMNSWFIRTDTQFPFCGRMNDDVNAYVLGSIRGRVFFTLIYFVSYVESTQNNGGGLSEEYKQKGTYAKTFYSVMCAPSAVKVFVMGDRYFRVHHEVSWNNCAPKIIPESFRVARDAR